MALKKLRQSLSRLQDALVKRSYYADKPKGRLQLQRYSSQITANLKFVEEHLWAYSSDIPSHDIRLELFVLLHKMKQTKDIRVLLMLCSDMEKILESVREARGQIRFQVGRLPEDVREEILADIDELKRCYEAKCYRSAVILCGRLLEIALHRTYFEKTGVDILEKNPGIGLGNLVKKLMEKNVSLDPGLKQQIHLINNVRVFSVHKKQRVFSPSKAQAHAIILFTLDILTKLF